jgi:hypothetical protein
MKKYTIYETLVSSMGNGGSYVVKEFEDLESAKEHLQGIKVELRELCDDLSNTWEDVIEHFGYTYDSSMHSSTLRFEIYELDNTPEESVIDDIWFDKEDFDNIQADIAEQRYKAEHSEEGEENE